jgi:phosphohistidine swiveling domain-containing protein
MSGRPGATERMDMVLDNDPLHLATDDPVWWTTVNADEGFPVVPTPLTWTVCGMGFEELTRAGWYTIGALRRSERATPAQAAGRFISIHYGRVAINVNLIREVGDRLPGMSGDAVEQQLFGGTKSGLTSKPQRGRYPIMAVKLPVAAIRCHRALHRLRTSTEHWWQDAVPRDGLDRDQLLAQMRAAQQCFLRVGTEHAVASMIALGLYGQVEKLASRAGLPGLEGKLLTSRTPEETRTVSDLWALSRGALTLGEFLRRHGYQGPTAGELSAQPWRENPQPVQTLVQTYQTIGEDESPAELTRRMESERIAAERALYRALGPRERQRAKALVHLGRRYVPLRELGRGTFLMAIDVARCTARAMGEALARAGTLDDPDDIFFLCADELRSPPPQAAEIVAARRRQRDRYEQVEPEYWQGSVVPTPRVAADGRQRADVLTGVGVSAGLVEGRARVVLGPLESETLEPGEILVCRTTDPSWASYFFVAAGTVIDVGGPLSHGAIVCRELGIPCVINVRTATRQIRTGDQLRVDGTSGEVTVLSTTRRQDT